MTKNPCWLIGVAAAVVAALHAAPPPTPEAGRDRYPLANGGPLATAGDYAKFAQMILRPALQETAAQP